jgi:hypothetical protein
MVDWIEVLLGRPWAPALVAWRIRAQAQFSDELFDTQVKAVGKSPVISYYHKLPPFLATSPMSANPASLPFRFMVSSIYSECQSCHWVQCCRYLSGTIKHPNGD